MDKDIQKLDEMKIFSSDVRREILAHISDSGSISYTELKEIASISDGGLYYHLKMMKKYLERDEQNYYRLNVEGKRAYNSLFHEKDYFIEPRDKEEKKSTRSLFDRLATSNMVYYFLSTRTRSIIELNVVLIIVAWLFGVTNHTFSSMAASFQHGIILNTLISIAHWYLLYVVILVILKLFKQDFNALDLLIAVLLGTFPYLLFLIPAGIFFLVFTNALLWVDIVLTVLLIVCKICSILLITGGISIISKCNKFYALIITSSLIVIDYIYIVIRLSNLV